MRTRRFLWMLPILALLAGCRRAADPPTDEASAPIGAPITALVPLAAGMPLDSMLARLEAELDAALEQGTGESRANERLLRAEAITDRLLDSRIPFAWLKTQNYSVDARLRQIQALADRVIAQIQSRAPRAGVLAEAGVLRDDVRRLRSELAQGGSAAPPALEELLAADSLALRAVTRPPPDTTT